MNDLNNIIFDDDFMKRANDILEEVENNVELKNIEIPDGTYDNIVTHYPKYILKLILEKELGDLLSLPNEKFYKDDECDLRLIENIKKLGIDLELITDEELSVFDKKVNCTNSKNINKHNFARNRMNSSNANNKIINMKNIFNIKRKSFYLVALLTILLFGTCLSSQSTKKFIVQKFIEDNETDSQFIINDKEILTDYNLTEEEIAYQRIKDELGLRPIKLNYKPEGMNYTKLVLDEYIKESIMFFEYKGIVIQLKQSLANKDFSETIIPKGKTNIIKNIDILNNSIDIYEITDESNNVIYLATIEINNNYYLLSSSVDKDLFIKIAENLSFYK